MSNCSEFKNLIFSIHVDLFILQRKFVNITIYILIVKFTELEYCTE